MTENRTSLEVIATDVDEALEIAAEELNLSEDQFDVQVLDEGSKGLFGMGSRKKRFKLTLHGSSTSVEDKPEEPEIPTEVSSTLEAEMDLDEDAETIRITKETVVELLQRMDVEAEVIAVWGQADAPGKIRPLFVDIKGDDLSLLIGRGGETLSAFQYITRLIVGKELKRPVAILIDVEGYRARRERQLQQLARRMASQAVETSRTTSLEPMPANERRIIHIELRDNPDVETESVGEGHRRKVTIIPKQ